MSRLMIGGGEPHEETDRCARPPQCRPLVVIDPEDRAQVERLLEGFMSGNRGNFIANADDLQAALREMADPTPPKPEVYSHIVTDAGPIKQALCGKVWRSSPDVTVVGKCPECLGIGQEWIA